MTLVSTAARGSSGAGAGALTFIGSSILGASAASISIGPIPGTYSALHIFLTLRTDAAAQLDVANVRFNGDNTAGNYDQAFDAQGTSANTGTTGPQTTGATATASMFAAYGIVIPQYAATTLFKSWGGCGFHDRVTGSSFFEMGVGGVWKNTAAITSVAVLPATGPNFVAGSSMVVYGLSAS
jgi:hypothetical protein